MKKWLKRLFIFVIILMVLGFLSSILARLPVGERVAVIKVKGAIIEPDKIVERIQRAKEEA